MNNFKPVHDHDCDACTYLKTVNIDNRVYDLYHCLQGSTRHTVIARYGVDGDYLSGLSCSDDGILRRAAYAAIEAGLLTYKRWLAATAIWRKDQ